MYVPVHFAMDDAAVRDLLSQHGAADLVTATPDGLLATMLPFVHEPDAGEHGALLGHVARNNDQWRREVVGEALVIVRGPDAYISPAGTRARPNTAGSSPPGTTSPRTSTGSWSCTTTRRGGRTSS